MLAAVAVLNLRELPAQPGESIETDARLACNALSELPNVVDCRVEREYLDITVSLPHVRGRAACLNFGSALQIRGISSLRQEGWYLLVRSLTYHGLSASISGECKA